MNNGYLVYKVFVLSPLSQLSLNTNSGFSKYETKKDSD